MDIGYGLFGGAWIPPIMQLTLIEDVDHYMGEQGRHSAESTRLPPMFASISPSVYPLIPPLNPGSDATRGFILLCYCLCVDRFLSGCSGFLPSLKTNQNTKNLIRNVVDEHHFEEVFPLKRQLFTYLFIYLFIYLICCFGRVLALFLGQF